MRLQDVTTESMARFKGGQLEIQNEIERYLLRGEIGEITVEGDQLTIRFAWLAKGEGFPPLPNRWVRDSNLDYSLPLMEGFTGVSDIGPSSEGGGNRLAINSVVSNEMLVFFPPDGSKLDRAKVEEPTAEEAAK
jgi:hypothetical protein